MAKLEPAYMSKFWQLANAHQEAGDFKRVTEAYNKTLQLAQRVADSSMLEDGLEQLEFLKS